jgi:hypothetical protein
VKFREISPVFREISYGEIPYPPYLQENITIFDDTQIVFTQRRRRKKSLRFRNNGNQERCCLIPNLFDAVFFVDILTVQDWFTKILICKPTLLLSPPSSPLRHQDHGYYISRLNRKLTAWFCCVRVAYLVALDFVCLTCSLHPSPYLPQQILLVH